MSRKRKFSEANRSPPKQPLSLKAIATLSVKELILEALDDDPAAVGHIKVDHVFSTEFNIYRILLPDGTPTPYVFCDHPSCLDKPNRDKVNIIYFSLSLIFFLDLPWDGRTSHIRQSGHFTDQKSREDTPQFRTPRSFTSRDLRRVELGPFVLVASSNNGLQCRPIAWGEPRIQDSGHS